jgi:hypothetical protein
MRAKAAALKRLSEHSSKKAESFGGQDVFELSSGICNSAGLRRQGGVRIAG